MTMPTRREYASGRPTTLAANINSGATTINITDATGWPTGGTGNFFITIAANTASEERVLCSSRTGTIVTVAAGGRGADGTAASSHSAGDDVWPSFSKTDADEANAHTSASASSASFTIHGLANGSSVVGTTDTQTLTNKTLTNPTLGGPTLSSDMNANSNKITNLATPTAATDAATKAYADEAGGLTPSFLLGGM